jgi:hypothetical protein
MVLQIIDYWVLLYVFLPVFQGLLQGLVADQLLLTVLPMAIRQTGAVQARIKPIVQHIVQFQSLSS